MPQNSTVQTEQCREKSTGGNKKKKIHNEEKKKKEKFTFKTNFLVQKAQLF